MADFNKKQYLDLAGLKAFWGIIKDNFVSEVSLSMGDAGAVFEGSFGNGDKLTIGTIPMATSTQAGLMSAAQAQTVAAFSDGVAAVVPLTSVKVNGTAAELADRAVNLDFIYDSTAKEIQVVDKNNSNAVLTKIDATAFIKDGMVSDVRLDGNNLVIDFNTDSGIQDIALPLDKFIDIYTGTNGVKVDGKVISLELNSDYLSADAAGLKVTDALWTKVGELDAAVAQAAAEDATTKADAAQAAAEATAKGYADDAQAAGEAAAAQALVDAKAYVDPKFAAIATEIGVKTGEGAPTGLYKEISDAETSAKGYADDQIEAAIRAVVGEGGTLAGTLEAAKSYTDAEVAKVNGTIGTVTTGKTVVKMIEDAQAAAAKAGTDAAAKAGTDAKAHSDANLATAKTYSDTNLATAKTYAEGQAAAAEASANGYTDEKIKDLKDNEIKTLQDKVAAIEGDEGAIADALADAKAHSDANLATAKTYAEGQAQAAKEYANGLKTTIDGVIEENEKVTAEALTDLDDRVKVLEAVDHDKILQDAKNYADGRINISGKTVKAYVDDADANVEAAAKAYTDTEAGKVYAAIEAIPVADITFAKLNA